MFRMKAKRNGQFKRSPLRELHLTFEPDSGSQQPVFATPARHIGSAIAPPLEAGVSEPLQGTALPQKVEFSQPIGGFVSALNTASVSFDTYTTVPRSGFVANGASPVKLEDGVPVIARPPVTGWRPVTRDTTLRIPALISEPPLENMDSATHYYLGSAPSSAWQPPVFGTLPHIQLVADPMLGSSLPPATGQYAARSWPPLPPSMQRASQQSHAFPLSIMQPPSTRRFIAARHSQWPVLATPPLSVTPYYAFPRAPLSIRAPIGVLPLPPLPKFTNLPSLDFKEYSDVNSKLKRAKKRKPEKIVGKGEKRRKTIGSWNRESVCPFCTGRMTLCTSDRKDITCDVEDCGRHIAAGECMYWCNPENGGCDNLKCVSHEKATAKAVKAKDANNARSGGHRYHTRSRANAERAQMAM